MPSISDEAGIKLLNILEMFGREMLRNKINESNRLRAEARDAKSAAKGLSNNGKGNKTIRRLGSILPLKRRRPFAS